MRLLAALLAALLLLGGLPGAAMAAGCPKTSVPDIEDEVMCLQCGVPLNVAEEAPSAKRERAFIQARVDQCLSKQQIKDQLVAQFGDRILAEPQKKAAWIVPAVGFAIGAVAIGFAAFRWRRGRRDSSQVPVAAGAPLSSGDAARLDADLDRFDR